MHAGGCGPGHHPLCPGLGDMYPVRRRLGRKPSDLTSASAPSRATRRRRATGSGGADRLGGKPSVESRRRWPFLTWWAPPTPPTSPRTRWAAKKIREFATAVKATDPRTTTSPPRRRPATLDLVARPPSRSSFASGPTPPWSTTPGWDHFARGHADQRFTYQPGRRGG
ncbi:hypothetical protein QJS66_20000 [Kocuria rhizophila]|nr:hypothetical protein QJS66_20000 [Kocuria rhizophila]